MLAGQLGKRLERISSLRGEANLSQVHPLYEKWYRETKPRFAAQPNNYMALAYFHRHRVHVLKLAVINEVSASCSLEVSIPSWNLAVQTAAELEQAIIGLLPTGMSSTGYLQTQMTQKVATAGANGLSLSEFTRAFQHMNKRQREDMLATIIQTGTVVVFNRHSNGRTGIRLAHRDFIVEYKAAYPDEKEASYWRRM
jgi:hypothetical protein